MTQPEEVLKLVEKIKPLLAHNEPQVQSAVLAELLSMTRRQSGNYALNC
jgi:hypothetical protein